MYHEKDGTLLVKKEVLIVKLLEVPNGEKTG
jgi:hypothetical protein